MGEEGEGGTRRKEEEGRKEERGRGEGGGGKEKGGGEEGGRRREKRWEEKDRYFEAVKESKENTKLTNKILITNMKLKVVYL